MAITISLAFFLSQTGDLIHARHNPIGTVIADPERLGLTKEEIQAAYDMHGERIGVEGEAGKELILKVISQRWIRLRIYPNRHWSVTAESLTPAVQELLRDWAEEMLSGVGGIREANGKILVKVATGTKQLCCTIKDHVEGSPPW